MKGTIGERFKKIREIKGLTQEEVAHKSGITTGYISRLERAESNYTNPTIDTIESLAKGLGVHPVELQYGVNPLENKGYQPLSQQNWFSIRKLHPIPLLKGHVNAGDFESACWQGDTWEGETILIPIEHVHDKMVCWRVGGKSMEPEYYNGALVVIDCGLLPENGQDVIARKNGTDEVTIKQFKKLDDGSTELRPYNKDYPTISLKAGETIEIIGVVTHKVMIQDMRKRKR